MVVDVENDPAAFIVEIATSGVDTYGYYDVGHGENGGQGDRDASKMEEEMGENGNDEDDESGNENSVFDVGETVMMKALTCWRMTKRRIKFVLILLELQKQTNRM